MLKVSLWRNSVISEQQPEQKTRWDIGTEGKDKGPMQGVIISYTKNHFLSDCMSRVTRKSVFGVSDQV